MLIAVIDRHGSSPGKVGFKMAVSESGAMIGSVGGGVMEYNMVELAKKEMQKLSPPELYFGVITTTLLVHGGPGLIGIGVLLKP